MIFLALPFALAACGGDDDGGSPDASISPDADLSPDAEPPVGACGAAVGAIASYPGSFAGTVLDGGADLTVAEGACTVEVAYFAPAGMDVVVTLTGLTVGTDYAVVLDTAEDLSVYIASDCDASGPAAGACLAFTDATVTTAETIYFTATTTTAYAIVDTYNDTAVTTGAFTLNVDAAECLDNTGCDGATPACVNFTCVECASSFDCTTDTAAVCDTAVNTCGAGFTGCTGDDLNDTTAPGDDGPAAATTLAVPATIGAPTTVNSGICSSPATEQDWFTFTTTAVGSYGFEVAWVAAATDLDAVLYDSAGAVVASAFTDSTTGPERFLAADLPVGTYNVMIYQYAPAATAAAIPYTLTMNVAECATSFDCTVGATPVCGTNGMCAATTANACVGDDTVAEAASDDGPAGATPLVSGVPITANLCNVPASEFDYYSLVVPAGGNASVSVAWADGAADLDPYVYSATGVLHGLSFWVNPEVVDLSYLPAGTYYVGVNRYLPGASTAVTEYTITATITATAGCTTSADCAAEYTTQFYRGACAAGACDFLAPGTRALGQPCDSGDDCMSGSCSYVLFESDASESVCTTTCTTNADCTAVGAGATCWAASGLCHPGCTGNLECGVGSLNSSALDTGEPWDYGVCDTTAATCSFPAP